MQGCVSTPSFKSQAVPPLAGGVLESLALVLARFPVPSAALQSSPQLDHAVQDSH